MKLSCVIPTLDEATVVYPGHDYEKHTHSPLADEKRNNINLRPRSRDDYVAWLMSIAAPTPEWMIETVRQLRSTTYKSEE